MNKVTVMNITTFEDCCTWISRFHGEKAREQFEAHITRIKPLISIAGSRLTPQAIVAVHKTLEGLLREDNVTLCNTCHYIENKYGKWGIQTFKYMLLLEVARLERPLTNEDLIAIRRDFEEIMKREFPDSE